MLSVNKNDEKALAKKKDDDKKRIVESVEIDLRIRQGHDLAGMDKNFLTGIHSISTHLLFLLHPSKVNKNRLEKNLSSL